MKSQKYTRSSLDKAWTRVTVAEKIFKELDDANAAAMIDIDVANPIRTSFQFHQACQINDLTFRDLLDSSCVLHS